MENFTSTFEEMSRTLERNVSQTKDIQARTARVLEEANAYRTNSLNKRGNCGKIIRNNKQQVKTYTRSPSLPILFSNVSISSHSKNSHQAAKKRETLQTGISQTRQTCTKTLSSSSTRDSAKENSNKLKNIVFKTLDTIFHIRNGVTKMYGPIDTNTPTKEIKPNPNRQNSFKLSDECEASKLSTRLDVADGKVEKEISTENDADEVETISSNSESENSWLYVDNPIHIEEVSLDESLNSSLTKPTTNMKATENAVSNFQLHFQKHSQNSKNVQRNDSKVKRLCNNMYSKEDKSPTIKLSYSPIIFPKTERKVRPDSPIKTKQYKPFLSSTSLQNLMEMSFEESNDNLPDFNTNSFSKEIALRPSSTLKNATRNFNPIHPIPHEEFSHEEDSLTSTSTTSSFISLQIPVTTTSKNQQQNKLRRVPSALCQNILVTPISVPIRPLKSVAHIKGVSTKDLKKISKTFADENGFDKLANKKNIANFQAFNDHNSAYVTDEEITIVRDAFCWLNDMSCEKENLTEDVTSKKQSNEDTNITNNSNYSGLNSSVPPPPPLPPPMPILIPKGPSTFTLRRRFPLAVFVQPRPGDNIFNQKDIRSIPERDAEEFKEKFRLTDNRHSSQRETRKQKISPRLNKLHLNTEVFLKKWNINDSNLSLFIESISTLNAKPKLIDMNCLSAIPMLKNNEICDGTGILSNAEKFLVMLSQVPHFHEKMACIKFALDFEESTKESFCKVELFEKTCNDIKASDKLARIVNLLTEFMNLLSPDENIKIYGFEIESLSKLATKTSADGTTTLLHFLIEYILNAPDVAECSDFYKDFSNISAVSKISVCELMDQCGTWETSLKLYKKQLKLISEDNHITEGLEFAMAFVTNADKVLVDFRDKLNLAGQAFISVKEYCSSNNEITEKGLFDSLLKFVNAYQIIHSELINKAQQIKTKRRYSADFSANSNKMQLKKNQNSHRKSCDARALFSMDSKKILENDCKDDELGQRLVEILDETNKRNRNRRRKPV